MRGLRPISVRSSLVALLIAAHTAPVAARDLPLTVPRGQLFQAEDLGVYAETFVLPAATSAALAASAPGDKIRLDAFPVAPGLRQTVELERYEVYAEGARVIVVEAGGERELPRSRRLHFVGSVPGDPITRIGFSLDPDARTLRGIVDSPLGRLRLEAPAPGAFEHRLETSEAARHRAGVTLETGCGNEELPVPDAVAEQVVQAPDEAALARARFKAARGAAPTHTAVIAVDTDNELMAEKFGDDLSAATDYVADLFTEMNVAYERDVSLRLLIGDTFLRPSTQADPWTVEGSGTSGNHLYEFRDYWSANMGNVQRVFAMMLSGKASSPYSASGIAWLYGYCSTTYGYSFTQVFTANFSSARIVAHELGHNFGSPHTHCYSPPVDNCYSAQPGCYSGPVSCPSGGSGRGTIMSYCHFSAPSGAACGSSELEFHPTVNALFTGHVLANAPGCIADMGGGGGGDELFVDDFESGGMNTWSQ